MHEKILGSCAASFTRAEFIAARCTKHSSTKLQNPANGFPIHLADVLATGDHTPVALTDGIHFNTTDQGCPHDGSDGGIHARRVTTAGQNGDMADWFVCHSLPYLLKINNLTLNCAL